MNPEMVLWGRSSALKLFTVSFCDNEIGAYFPGQYVKVKVIVVCVKPLEIRGIRLAAEGQARAEWKDDRVRGKHDKFSQTETFIDEKVTLWGKDEGQEGGNPILNPGSYEFIFSFIIPMNSPPNYEAGQIGAMHNLFGWIRYSCRAFIDIPWYSNEERVASFTVLSTLDLNGIPNSVNPRQRQESKELEGCFGLCCVNGLLECTASVQRTGFLPGESIIINAEIDNKTTRGVDQVDVMLIEVVVYNADGNTCYSKQVIASLTKGYIAPGHSQLWNNEHLLIPDTRASITTCSVIQLFHVLEIKVVPKGCNVGTFEVDFPIVIGNIRLRTETWNENNNVSIDVQNYF